MRLSMPCKASIAIGVELSIPDFISGPVISLFHSLLDGLNRHSNMAMIFQSKPAKDAAN
jgi:hypothetical protein